jgi:hypothetical protein
MWLGSASARAGNRSTRNTSPAATMSKIAGRVVDRGMMPVVSRQSPCGGAKGRAGGRSLTPCSRLRSEGDLAAVGPHRQAGRQLWVTGCSCDKFGITAGVPKKADDLLQRSKSAESGHNRTFSHHLIQPSVLDRPVRSVGHSGNPAIRKPASNLARFFRSAKRK